MSKRVLVLICSVFLIVPLLFMGCGNDGATGAAGDNGTNAPTTGTIAGTVTDAVKLDGILGVTVTAKGSDNVVKGTATTDATGAYSLANLPLGTVTVYFAQTDYTSPGGMTVGVLGGQTVTINAALSEAAAGGPSVSITGYNSGMYTTDDFGYGGTAALAASGSDPNGDTLTYAWSNATAPVLGSVSGSGTTATTTFPTLVAAMATRPDTANNGTISGYAYLNGRFGILPILPDTRGAVSTKVTVTDGRGQSASVTLALNAASVLTGARNVPRGARVYMNRGNDNASQTWAITVKPTGSAAALDNASIRTPSFVADVTGVYTLTAGSNTITLNAGTWTGIIDAAGATTTGYTVGQEGACRTCHNGTIAVNEFDDWYATAHSKIFTLGVTGGSGTTGASCLTCHTVGFDRGTNNGGFDDLASSTGWVFPTRNSTAWTSMVTNYPTVAKLANIQCENCHGPQASPGHMSTGPLGAIDNNNKFASDRIAYSAELCATCHASGTGHNLYSQWASSGHANASLAVSRGSASAGTTTNSCGRCHSAQGFTIYADQLKAGNVGYIDNATSPAFFSSVNTGNVEPQTCTACHDPHDVTNPNQLRLFDNVTLLPSGFGIRTFGKGAICTACHNTRNGVYMDNTGAVTSNTTAFLHEDGQTNGTPFAITGHDHTQADVFTGRNAYFMGGNLPMMSKHAAVEDTCVGCHMALNPTTHLSHGAPAVDGHRFGINTTNMATYCGNCHGAGTVNGEAIQASTQAGLDSVKASMEAAMLTFLRVGGARDNIVIVGQSYYDNGTRVGSSTSSVTVNTAGANITGARYTSGATFEFTITGQTNKVRASLFIGSATANPAMSVKWGGGATGFDTSSIIYKACWNVVMITNDFSLGIHNPTFVQQVLNNTKWNLDQYGPVAAP